MGKIGFNSFLVFIKRTDNPGCFCGEAPETVHHVLLNCSCYRALWRAGGDSNPGPLQTLAEALTEL
ncbi:uncharacterized protein BO66DRAFT_392416 [Aspergillus aculeatinus CBS 121060]|uniref:Uncharacterized protein n=1 Tax=Aspergillus aculeatinus CBS 121060 TaxID=1448322 RepID=A0ACD1H7Q7_9EURO|nr:hypothetical protein BO66DRAFT_392416 [Aspergillus aculeatinus CBS 121060]RAH69442.1 hypothetical protein BO66DRAFT_392416 [Aspergillus aculeatinus CBS 121060]